MCAHCDCMAGLGEVCSYIGAILFTSSLSTVSRAAQRFRVHGICRQA